MKDTGGSAFPAPGNESGAMPERGMRLRDYIAIKAMTSLIGSNDSSAGYRPEELAEDAYLIADAMIAQRKKE